VIKYVQPSFHSVTPDSGPAYSFVSRLYVAPAFVIIKDVD
jgi:hypothetical protein